MIALVGQSVLDRITEPGREPEERLGGAPIFAGHAIEQTNRRAIIITRGGTPELRAPLRELGLRVVEGPSDATFISVLELFADGTRNHEVASFGTPFTPADVEGWMAPALEGIDVVVCGTQWRQDFEAPVLAALAAGGRTVLLDGQGPLRTARLGPLLLRRELEAAELAGVAVLKLAEDEADALGALHDLTRLDGLAVPTVIVTRGHVGSTVRTAGRTVEVPGIPCSGWPIPSAPETCSWPSSARRWGRERSRSRRRGSPASASPRSCGCACIRPPGATRPNGEGRRRGAAPATGSRRSRPVRPPGRAGGAAGRRSSPPAGSAVRRAAARGRGPTTPRPAHR